LHRSGRCHFEVTIFNWVARSASENLETGKLPFEALP
jgi:hypothetical protein